MSQWVKRQTNVKFKIKLKIKNLVQDHFIPHTIKQFNPAIPPSKYNKKKKKVQYRNDEQKRHIKRDLTKPY